MKLITIEFTRSLCSNARAQLEFFYSFLVEKGFLKSFILIKNNLKIMKKIKTQTDKTKNSCRLKS